jgi:hypothetical protein
MKQLLVILVTLFFPISALSEEAATVNYCHDDQKNQDWEKMVADYPNDPIIIKLAGLRVGLCVMIDRGQITHEQGVNLWEEERQRSIVERSNDDAKKAPKYVL